MQNFLVKTMVILILTPLNSYGQNFFEQRYRGWLWFEENAQDESKDKDFKEKQQATVLPSKEEIEKAKLDNEQFKEELADLRHLIIRYPDNLNYIRLYKEKEKEMLDGAMRLAGNFAMVNFLRPDIADQLKNPQNIYGRNVAKSEKEERDRQIIKSLAAKVELFVFRQDSCSHCSILEKHLNSFAKKYGFKVEAVSQDNSASSYFKTHNNLAIIKELALTVMPTVIAVTKDSKMRFELARGAVSIPDLEDKALLLAKFLNSKQLNNQHLNNQQRQEGGQK
jgi:thiol-disulfide isomerase/thioredoxin